MKMEFYGGVRSGATEIEILAQSYGTGTGNYSSKEAAMIETRRAMDEDKPTPDWSQGGKVELD